jgi:hypothetical protein
MRVEHEHAVDADGYYCCQGVEVGQERCPFLGTWAIVNDGKPALLCPEHVAKLQNPYVEVLEVGLMRSQV